MDSSNWFQLVWLSPWGSAARRDGFQAAFIGHHELRVALLVVNHEFTIPRQSEKNDSWGFQGAAKRTSNGFLWKCCVRPKLRFISIRHQKSKWVYAIFHLHSGTKLKYFTRLVIYTSSYHTYTQFINRYYLYKYIYISHHGPMISPFYICTLPPRVPRLSRFLTKPSRASTSPACRSSSSPWQSRSADGNRCSKAPEAAGGIDLRKWQCKR